MKRTIKEKLIDSWIGIALLVAGSYGFIRYGNEINHYADIALGIVFIYMSFKDKPQDGKK